MKQLVLHRALSLLSALVLFVASPALHAQVYTELHNFDWHKEGANPLCPAQIAPASPDDKLTVQG